MQPGRPRARVVLLGGASGSGKTRLARSLGVPRLRLDEFYRDGDDPLLRQHFGDGSIDWDDPASWDVEAAIAALTRLCLDGVVDVPIYDIAASRRTGSTSLDLLGSPVVLAEGIFAAEVAPRLQSAGLLADALCLNRNRHLTFARRLARDLAQSRKPVPVLLRRGMFLRRTEPAMSHRWSSLGCRLVDRDTAVHELRSLLAAQGLPAARLHPQVDFLAVLEDAVTAIDGIVGDVVAGDVELASAVPSCPGWTVRDLVEHVGGVHRWARVALVEGHGGHTPEPAPSESTELRQWFAEGAQSLLSALRASDARDECWTFADTTTAAFWWRRQAHETAMRAWDLSSASGRPYSFPPGLAGDGIDEVVDLLLPRQIRKNRMPAPTMTLGLHAHDTEQQWQIRSSTDTVSTATVSVSATVSGAASDLLLLLWRRRTVDDPRFEVAGDVEAARRLLSSPLTP